MLLGLARASKLWVGQIDKFRPEIEASGQQ
jgi:hypothetical protein